MSSSAIFFPRCHTHVPPVVLAVFLEPRAEFFEPDSSTVFATLDLHLGVPRLAKQHQKLVEVLVRAAGHGPKLVAVPGRRRLVLGVRGAGLEEVDVDLGDVAAVVVLAAERELEVRPDGEGLGDAGAEHLLFLLFQN
jgi:hypothetical protein